MKKIKNLEIFIFLLFFSLIYSFPLNIYSVFSHSYEKRLLNTYGYCGKESYGYVRYIFEKYNTNLNFHSHNFQDFPSTSTAFFYNINKDFDKNKHILLNYYSEDLESDKKIINIFGRFKILDQYQNNCFFIERLSQ